MPINANKFYAKDLYRTSANYNVSLLPFQTPCLVLPGRAAIKINLVAKTGIRQRCILTFNSFYRLK